MPVIFSSPCKKASIDEKVIFHDCINGSDPVLPANFFALSICAAVVGDAYLINPRSSPRNLRDKFRFNAEPILLDRDTIQEFASKNFVTTSPYR